MEQNLYWWNAQKQTIYKITSPTTALLVQIIGRDINLFFTHRHEHITFPDADRLQKELADAEPSDADKYQAMLMDYLHLQKEKLRIISLRRQMLYDKGLLKL